MQNYRNHSMPYGNGYKTNYNTAPRCAVPTPAVTAECCNPAGELQMSCKDDMLLAMAYVKWQTWQKIYDVEKALHFGTIFQELNLPFCGVGGCQK